MTETRKSPVSFILKDTLLPWRGMLLSSGAELLDYPAGSVLSRSGEVNQHIYFLLRGIVKTYTSNASGYLRLLGYHKANTIFTLDNLRGGEPAVVSNEALTSITVLRFTPELLQRICRQNPAFATDLALYVGDVLRLMCFDAEKQSIDDVQTRLATFMCLYIESNLRRKERGAHDAGIPRLGHQRLAYPDQPHLRPAESGRHHQHRPQARGGA